MIDLAADKSIDGEPDEVDDCVHAIRTSASCAIDNVKAAYDLIDDISGDLIRRVVAEAEREGAKAPGPGGLRASGRMF